MTFRFLTIAPAIMLCACSDEEQANGASTGDGPEQSEIALVASPGRCQPSDASFTIAAGEEQSKVMPYVQCLTTAEQEYGFNDGPHAVQQCKSSRADVLGEFAQADQENIEYLLTQIDREYVWLQWCSTDVGSELPAGIEVRSDWPQAESKMQ